MSVDLEMQLREDRALRNAARALVDADMAHLRTSLSGRSISSRIFGRFSEGAADVFEEAVEVAEHHKGVLATLVAAIVIWFARHPLGRMVGMSDEETELDGEDDRWSDEDIQGYR